MLVYLDYRALEVHCAIGTEFELAIEPGLWLIEQDGVTHSVTTINGRLASGRPVFHYPRAVVRRPSGAWAARERVLYKHLIFADMPEGIRSAVNDAYLLQRRALPESLETP